MFEDIGFDYYGPYDGNDIKTVIKILERVKKSKKPCLVHFITKKVLVIQMLRMMSLVLIME